MKRHPLAIAAEIAFALWVWAAMVPAAYMDGLISWLLLVGLGLVLTLALVSAVERIPSALRTLGFILGTIAIVCLSCVFRTARKASR